MPMNDYFDALETRSPDEREAQQFEQLHEQLRYARANIPAYTDLLQGCLLYTSDAADE